MSRAAANISRRQFMRRRAFGPRRGGLGEYGGYIAQNKAQAMLGGRFTGRPTSSPQISLSRGSPYRKGLALSRKGGGKGSTLRFALPMN